ncbi:uncharacterized protein BT62DRAFT_22748 [Guyanagaster necrorhizus]|uniref:Uncharacterized protein n=1 Tax=Guyanagaster necrorhizus TaxID=856835 RepID=A0A9P8AYJ7_9AGAR|nr:uncharacterized protein BT62DRAFT_22748 [Guyanagaster necrorhizus MCA 3950]KAG7452718.1 hypothetical protein BT62DRAFT_22748 [Guyanagaster necrorhizus MCA 3950]
MTGTISSGYPMSCLPSLFAVLAMVPRCYMYWSALIYAYILDNVPAPVRYLLSEETYMRWRTDPLDSVKLEKEIDTHEASNMLQ